MLNINKISTSTIIPSSITHFAAADHTLGYGIGKIVREAFEHLFFSQDKITLSTEDVMQIKPNLSENDLQIRMKRTIQQTGSGPASFNLTSLNGSNGFSVYGLAPGGENLGYSVSSAGDLNGDGITDLVLGAYQASPGGLANAGAAYVLFGSNASWPTGFNLNSLNGTNGFSVFGSAPDDYLGSSVCCAGDLNGDGITDLVLGAYWVSPGGANKAGAAYVLFGSKTSWPASFNLNSLSGTNGFSVYGPGSNDYLGGAVSSAGDLNGDGITDLVLGASGASPGGHTDAGAAYVLFGSNASWPASFNLNSLNGTNGFSVYGLASDDFLGVSISYSGDLNGDGITDLVLGAPGASPGGRTYAGAAYVLFGSKTSWTASFNLNSLNGTNGFSVYGNASGDWLGTSFSSAGDFNGDGITDLVLGADEASPNGLDQAGAAYVLFGSKASWTASFNLNSLNGTNGFSVYGHASGDWLITSFSSAGDFNGDGITDLFLGAYRASPGGLANAGAAYVLFGSKARWTAFFNLSSLNGTNGFSVYGLASNDHLGTSVSSAGDLNGDGIMDLVLGASQASPGGFSYAGAAYILFGSRAPFINSQLTAPSMISTSSQAPPPAKTFIPSSTIFSPAISANSPTNSFSSGSQKSSSPIPPSPFSTIPSTPILFTPSPAISANSPTNTLIPGSSGPITSTVGIAAGVTSAGVVMIVAGVIVLLWCKKKGCFAPSDRSTSIDHHDLEDARSIKIKTFE